MEMFEIRYFLTVAELESVEKASKRLNVSGSALSKAVSRLQEELNVKLFEKDGRNIRLTAKGQVLLAKCKQIVELEKETKILIAEEQSAFEVRIAGPEVFLTKFALPLVAEIKKKYPAMWVSFLNVDEETAQAKVANDEADLCYVGEGSERHLDLTYKEIERVPFHTYASNKHPLAKQRGGAIPVEKVLSFEFLTPADSLLGSFNSKGSSDGWRDDRFPRKLTYRGMGLKSIEHLLLTGEALAYLPEYLGRDLPLTILNIVGCPYSCQQKIMLAGKAPKQKSWLKPLWEKFK